MKIVKIKSLEIKSKQIIKVCSIIGLIIGILYGILAVISVPAKTVIMSNGKVISTEYVETQNVIINSIMAFIFSFITIEIIFVFLGIMLSLILMIINFIIKISGGLKASTED